MRHPGAQFVVDRDGIIYSTTDPDMATVHINTSKTLPGYTNDNSVGIEIVRAGSQRYTQVQLDSVMYLVSYLQSHYHVIDTNVTTHHHVQPSDRSDPVGFDLLAFQKAKVEFDATAIASGSSQSIDRQEAPNRTASPVVSMARQASHRLNSGRVQTVSQIPKPAPDFRLFHPQSR
jgi:N-acetyl-anhydromuramyl-L-alanine amidase AmpD